MRLVAVGGGISAVMVLVLGSYCVRPEATRNGQFVFVPTPTLGVTDTDQVAASVRVVACVMVQEGLRVSGRADATGPVTVIAVDPGARTGVGTAVGAGQQPGYLQAGVSGPGSFEVTLPFASAASEFAVVQDESLAVSSGPIVTGRSARCPDVGSIEVPGG